MSIYITHDWINDITIDDSYDYLYELLILCTYRSITIMNEVLNHEIIQHNFDKTKIMNAIILYGISVYYLNKLIHLPLFIKIHQPEKNNLLKNKLNSEYKSSFYEIFINQINNFIIQYEAIEYYNIYVQELSNNKMILLSLLVDCCESIEKLNFNSLLVFLLFLI